MVQHINLKLLTGGQELKLFLNIRQVCREENGCRTRTTLGFVVLKIKQRGKRLMQDELHALVGEINQPGQWPCNNEVPG